jgi:hydrogenase nickel incorporation protein HypA/HybF
MHEVSLAAGVLQLVEEAAAREAFGRVLSLRLAAGRLAGVDVHALSFALESLAPGTLLEGAHVEIDEPPGQAWCLGCQQSITLERRGEACPACGGHRLHPTGGTELRVVDLVVADR